MLIPTNTRTSIRVIVPSGTVVQPWTIEFRPSDPDLVRLYSVDGDPRLIIVETNDREGELALACYLGQHGEVRDPTGYIDIEISRDAPGQDGELEMGLR